jgi:CheY-like chemotaxis protein
MILQEMLEDAGAQVTFAADGAEAVTAIKHAAPPFDVILCDIEMPNMDGYEAARSIKARALRSSDSRRMPLQQRGTSPVRRAWWATSPSHLPQTS